MSAGLSVKNNECTKWASSLYLKPRLSLPLPPVVGQEGKSAYMQNKIDALPILAAGDTKGLRIDISIVNPVTNDTLWVDVSAVHTSSPS